MSVSLWLNSQDATRITPLAIKGIREMIIAYLNEAKWYYYQLQDAAAAGNYDSIVHCINNGAVPDTYSLALSYSHNITDTRCYEILASPALTSQAIAFAVDPNGPFVADKKAGYGSNYLKWVLSKSDMPSHQVISAIETSIKTCQIELLMAMLREYPQAKVEVLRYIVLAINSSWCIMYHLLSQVLPYVSKADMISNCDSKDLRQLNDYVTGKINSSTSRDIRYYFGIGPSNQGITLGQCQQLTIFGRCNNKCSVFNTACNTCSSDQPHLDSEKKLWLDRDLGITMAFYLTVIDGLVAPTDSEVIYQISADNKQCRAYCKTTDNDRVDELTPKDIDSLKRLHLYDLPELDYSDLRT